MITATATQSSELVMMEEIRSVRQKLIRRVEEVGECGREVDLERLCLALADVT